MCSYSTISSVTKSSQKVFRPSISQSSDCFSDVSQNQEPLSTLTTTKNVIGAIDLENGSNHYPINQSKGERETISPKGKGKQSCSHHSHSPVTVDSSREKSIRLRAAS